MDETALVEAIRTGRSEPPRSTSSRRSRCRPKSVARFHHVILGQHNASNTTEAIRRTSNWPSKTCSWVFAR